MNRFFCICLYASLVCFSLSAHDACEPSDPICTTDRPFCDNRSLNIQKWIKTYGMEAYVGPEIYYAERTREGGTKQTGTLYGFRLGLDRIARYKLYSGADFLYATGILNGTGKGGDSTFKSKSLFTDVNAEGRFGYTFQSKTFHCASLTPFVGFGYFWETNAYKNPTPLHIHFKNRFSYIPFGFLSQIFITPQWSIGANVKIRYLLEAYQEVSHDPEHDDATQHYVKKLQYRIELPITYFPCLSLCDSLALSAVPFYEFRQYGRLVNFPFDFLETKLALYGATIKLLYLF